MKVEDLSTNPWLSKWHEAHRQEDWLSAKQFRIEGHCFEIGEDNGEAYIKCRPSVLANASADVLAVVGHVGLVADALSGLNTLGHVLDDHGWREEYIKHLAEGGDDYHEAYPKLNLVLGQEYFDVPPKAQSLIDDLLRVRNNKIDGYVYILKSDSGYWKIGRAKNPANRIETFHVKLPFVVNYEIVIPATGYVALEQELHARFDYCRVNGEWFELTDGDIADLKREFKNVAEQFNE